MFTLREFFELEQSLCVCDNLEILRVYTLENFRNTLVGLGDLLFVIFGYFILFDVVFVLFKMVSVVKQIQNVQ